MLSHAKNQINKISLILINQYNSTYKMLGKHHEIVRNNSDNIILLKFKKKVKKIEIFEINVLS